MNSKALDVSERSNHRDTQKYTQGQEIDNGTLDKLDAIIAKLEDDGDSKNFQLLIEFFQKGFASQAIQAWSYFAQVNNHPKFSHSTKTLTKVLRMVSSESNVAEYGSTMIRLILSSYVKVLYRGCNNMRVSLTNPILEFMKEMILFNSCQHLEEFITYFDLSLPSLARMLTPNKSDIGSTADQNSKSNSLILRHTFIKFWLDLISNCPALLRKDLITDNFRIMSAWFKYMDKVDNAELIERTIDVFIENILKEKSFKRMSKTKILNELALSKIHTFYYSANKTLVKKTNEFFIAYGCTPETSIAFPDNSVWFSESPNSNGAEGVEVVANQKTFKIFNKLLFNVLKNFKPWEDDMQSSTVIKILNHVPELIPPYCNLLASQGSHDPRMTSYWFGSTLVLGRIINLRIPEFMERIETDSIPSLPLVMENIIPSLLTKNALTKALQHEFTLIRQMACQLLAFTFQKLEKVLELYDAKGWQSAKVTLTNAVYTIIPDLSVITTALNQAYSTNKDNKILSLSLTEILKHYSKRFPNFFTINLPAENIYTDIMKINNFKGIDLTILDGFLQYQEFNGMQTRWWNATANSSSLFTSFLKLASSKNSSNAISHKICKLLDGLLHGTIIFNKNNASSIEALVNSLQVISLNNSEQDLEKLWKVLDETISRCVRTPYKYVDMSQKHDNISPFIMALLEQWKFIDSAFMSDILSKWICIFFRYMIIIGEAEQGIASVYKDFNDNLNEDFSKIYLDFANYEEKLSLLNDGKYLISNRIDSSFFEYIMLLPFNKMNNINRYPVSDLDIYGLLFRINLMLTEETIIFNKEFKNAIKNLLQKLSTFIITGSLLSMVESNIYKPILSKITQVDLSAVSMEKCSFASSELLANILKTENINEEFKNFTFKWLTSVENLIPEDDPSKQEIIGNIIQCFDSKSIKSLMEDKFQFTTEYLSISLAKLLEDDTQNLKFALFEEYLNDKSNSIILKLTKFVLLNKITEFNDKIFLKTILNDIAYSPLLKAYIQSDYFKHESLLPFLEDIKSNIDTSLHIAIATVNEENDQIKSFNEELVKRCAKLYKSNQFPEKDEVLKLFSLYFDYLSKEEQDGIKQYVISEYSHKYSPAVIKFMCLCGTFEDTTTEKWMNKLSLYVTKYLSERNELSEKFSDVINQFIFLFEQTNIWDKVNPNILNSQLEVILSGNWISNELVLKFTGLLLVRGNATITESKKLMNLLLNNENNMLITQTPGSHLSFLTVSIIYTLYLIDDTENSNRFIQERLLEFYNGTISIEDRIILRILENIEAKNSLSWTNYIYTWDFLEEYDEDSADLIGQVNLITKQREGLVLTLRKDLIKQTVENYVLQKPVVPEIDMSNVSKTWSSLSESYASSKNLGKNALMYDPMFLMLLIVHNDELVHGVTSDEGEVSYKFEIKKLISSSLFRVIICGLADDEVTSISNSLLIEMMNSLEENVQFKEGFIFKILLKRIVYTFAAAKRQIDERIQVPSPIIWFFISRISDILIQPSSPLYEKAFRWVLNGHFIRFNEIPLLQELIVPPIKGGNYENYYKQLSWVLECLEQGIKTEKDVNLLNAKGVFEWLLNTLSSPYLNSRLKSLINSIFYKVQRIDNGGSTLLTRFAILSSLELNDINHKKILNEIEGDMRRDSKNKNEMRSALTLKEQKLNTEELIQGFSEIISSQKRLAQWVDDDCDNIVKRVCK